MSNLLMPVNYTEIIILSKVKKREYKYLAQDAYLKNQSSIIALIGQLLCSIDLSLLIEQMLLWQTEHMTITCTIRNNHNLVQFDKKNICRTALINVQCQSLENRIFISDFIEI